MFKTDQPMPEHKTTMSAGFDIASTESYVLEPGDRYAFKTGLWLDLDVVSLLKDCYLKIVPKSGLAYKNGITVLNSPGTVDFDYPDEIKVILYNASKVPFEVKAGMYIAQGMVVKTEKVLNSLDVKRTGGFGSTTV